MDLRDERGVVISWLVKLLVAFAVAGVVLFDAGAIVVNSFTLSSTATDIANALATSAQQAGAAPNENQLEIEGRQLADDAGAKLVDVTVDSASHVIEVTLRRKARTLIVGRVDAIAKWARATADASSGYD